MTKRLMSLLLSLQLSLLVSPSQIPLSEVNAQSNNESASAAETTQDLAQADIEDLAAAPSSQQAKESQE
jgi:rRNA maturation endonuclease Nob1